MSNELQGRCWSIIETFSGFPRKPLEIYGNLLKLLENNVQPSEKIRIIVENLRKIVGKVF